MATDNTGIMALPEADQAAMPALSIDDSYDAVKSALREAQPQVASEMDAVMQELIADVEDMSDEELDSMINIVEQMHDTPDQYPQLRAQLIADGQADEEDLPPEYDPEFLAIALSVLMEAKRSRAPAMEGPQGFARGGIADAARIMAGKGRYGDTMLAHITPREARMLRRKGGSGTINPNTGLPEFFLKKLFKKIGKAIKKVLQNPIGKIIGTIALASFLGPIVGTAFATPLASAGTTLMAGGDLKDAFKSAAFSYIAAPGNPISDYVSGAVGGATSLTGSALQAATSGLVGTGVGLLSGQKFGDAVKSGFMSAALTAGTKAFGGAPAATQEPAPVADMGPMAASEAAGPSIGQAVAPVPGLEEGAISGGFKPYTPGEAAAAGPQGPVPTGVQPRTAAPGATTIPGQPTPPTVAAPKVPTIGESLSKIGEGLGMGQGPASFSTLKEGIGNLFSPSLSNEQLRATPEYADAISKGKTMAEAMQQAAKSYDPGMLRSYGPAAVAGIAGLGLMGGFKVRPVEMSPEGKEMRERMERERKEYEASPGMYTPKGLERFGAVYNDKGQIVGWNQWSPQSAGAFLQYAAPQSYLMPSTNMASMMAPVRMADGGSVSERVTQLYRDVLGREPDPEGLSFWTKKFASGVGPSQVEEFRQIAAPEVQSRENVRKLYRETLYRDPDAEGLSYWASRFGPTVEASERESFLQAGQPEVQALSPYVNMYREVLGRAPDMAGLADFRNRFGAEIDPEERAQFVTAVQPEINRGIEAIGGLYRDVLKRDPEQEGLDYWRKEFGAEIDPAERERFIRMAGPEMQRRREAAVNNPVQFAPPGADGQMAWNTSPAYRNYIDMNLGTPTVPTASVLGGQIQGPANNPFAAGLQMRMPPAPLGGQFPPPRADDGVTPLPRVVDDGSAYPLPITPPGGIANLASGGYPRRTGQINGPGTEKSDSIPAMLSDGEFVMTAKAVRGAGGGSRREGAKRMYALMHRLEKNASRG